MCILSFPMPPNDDFEQKIAKAIYEISAIGGKQIKWIHKQYHVISVSFAGNGCFVERENDYVYSTSVDYEYGFKYLIKYEDDFGNKFNWVFN